MSILQSIYRAIFGYDIFISYSRLDSLDYAYAIAKHFMKKNYECYIDQLSSTAPGESLTPIIEQAVKRSTGFVLIGSEGAQKSTSIQDEITLFLNSRKNKPFIAISVENAICDKAIWHKDIVGLPLKRESQANLLAKIPGEDVFERIENAMNFTKKGIRLRRIAFTIFISVLAITIFSYVVTTKNVLAAKEASKRERDSKKKTETALLKEQQANVAARKSANDKLLADTAAAKAVTLQQQAQRDALIAKENERVSKAIARSNYLITKSNLLDNKYEAMDSALLAYSLNSSDFAGQNVSNLFLKYPFIFNGSTGDEEKLKERFVEPKLGIQITQNSNSSELEITFKSSNKELKKIIYNLNTTEKYNDAELFQQESNYLILLNTYQAAVGNKYILCFDKSFNLQEVDTITSLDEQIKLKNLKALFRYKYNSFVNFVMVFNDGLAKGSVTNRKASFDFEESGIKIDRVFDFIESKNTLVVSLLTGLFIFPVEGDARFPIQETAINFEGIFPDICFSIGERFLGILFENHFYVLDLDFNPNVPNDRISVEEVIQNMRIGKRNFLSYIAKN